MFIFITFMFFFIVMIYMAIFHNSYTSKLDFMHYEICDKVSCEYCMDREQCKR